MINMKLHKLRALLVIKIELFELRVCLLEWNHDEMQSEKRLLNALSLPNTQRL